MPMIALKRLTKSDVTIIARHYRARKAVGDDTAQKSIALPQTTFINKFFPNLPDIFAELRAQAQEQAVPGERVKGPSIPFPVTVYGPAAAQPFPATANITKTQRNWRLNGSFRDLRNAEGDWDIGDRFSGMLPGEGDNDFVQVFVRTNNIAIIEFFGQQVPTGGRIAFVANPSRATGLCSSSWKGSSAAERYSNVSAISLWMPSEMRTCRRTIPCKSS